MAIDALTIRDGGDHLTVTFTLITRIGSKGTRCNNGILIGLGVGAVCGATRFQMPTRYHRAHLSRFSALPAPSLPVYLGIWGGLGTALGAAVDALIVRRDRTVLGALVSASW